MSTIKNYKELVKKVENITLKGDIDLSSGEDLSIGIMNLISIEEHLFFTYQKTNDKRYITMLNEIRALRTTLLKEIIQDYEGEVWCISKHLLASSMRLMEVGTKELKKKNDKKAESLFKNSYKLYTLFWGLNLSNTKASKTANLSKVAFLDERGHKKGETSVFFKLGNIINKALDCCRE